MYKHNQMVKDEGRNKQIRRARGDYLGSIANQFAFKLHDSLFHVIGSFL